MGQIDRLSGALSSDEKLILAARWSPNGSASFAIHLPMDMIKFDGDVKMDSLVLAVQVGAPPTSPSLFIKGGLIVPVSGPGKKTLKFGLSCELTASGDLTIAGTMDGMWDNPFDISPELSIGNLALMGTIQVPTFTPNGLGVAGELHVGKASAKAAFYISAGGSE